MTNESKCTLQEPRVVELLARLDAESKASNAKIREMLGNISPEERQRHMSNPNSDYREFYGRVKDHYLAVGPETARLLYMLGRSSGAKQIVEYGTSFGISTLHLAAAIRDNGGGRIIGSELEPAKAAKARENLATAGLADLADIREGDAVETLARDLPDSIDLVLLDGFKPLYGKILDLVRSRLRPGAILVADNVDAAPDYVARVRQTGGDFMSVPFSDEVEVSMFLRG